MASSPEGNDLTALFEVIRRQFVAGLAERGRALDEAHTPQQLQAVLHRLAGAAGAFGYDTLGSMARQALQASEADDGRLAWLLVELRSEMRRIAG